MNAKQLQNKYAIIYKNHDDQLLPLKHHLFCKMKENIQKLKFSFSLCILSCDNFLTIVCIKLPREKCLIFSSFQNFLLENMCFHRNKAGNYIPWCKHPHLHNHVRTQSVECSEKWRTGCPFSHTISTFLFRASLNLGPCGITLDRCPWTGHIRINFVSYSSTNPRPPFPFAPFLLKRRRNKKEKEEEEEKEEKKKRRRKRKKISLKKQKKSRQIFFSWLAN